MSFAEMTLAQVSQNPLSYGLESNVEMSCKFSFVTHFGRMYSMLHIFYWSVWAIVPAPSFNVSTEGLIFRDLFTYLQDFLLVFMELTILFSISNISFLVNVLRFLSLTKFLKLESCLVIRYLSHNLSLFLWWERTSLLIYDWCFFLPRFTLISSWMTFLIAHLLCHMLPVQFAYVSCLQDCKIVVLHWSCWSLHASSLGRNVYVPVSQAFDKLLKSE